MNASVVKIIVIAVLLIVIPGAIIISPNEGIDTWGLTLYYLYLTVAIAIFYISRKVIAFLNRKK